MTHEEQKKKMDALRKGADLPDEARELIKLQHRRNQV